MASAASETRNIDHVTLSPRLQACLSTAPYRTPHAHAFPFRLVRLLSPASSRRPPCAIGRLPLQIVVGSTPSPSQSSRSARRTPKPSAQDQASPHRIGRHQKHKTPLLFVARVAHRPWPSSLEVWTSSRFRRIAARFGIAQVKCTLLLFLFCFRRSALHSLAFPIRLRPCYRARRLVSHPPTSARSSPRSRPTFNKFSRVRTSHTTPCNLSPAASISSP